MQHNHLLEVSNLAEELYTEEINQVDQAILSTLKDTSMSLKTLKENIDAFSSEALMSSIKRLFITDEITKYRDGKTILYKLSSEEEKRAFAKILDGDDGTPDGHNVSKLARKFRSCRYIVKRDFSAKNGLEYNLMIEKKGQKFYIMYYSSFDQDKEVFQKMLENDNDIRIVTADSKSKIEVAKSFDDFVNDEYGEDGMQEFSKNHAFLILTMEQFFRKTTWKDLLQ